MTASSSLSITPSVVTNYTSNGVVESQPVQKEKKVLCKRRRSSFIAVCRKGHSSSYSASTTLPLLAPESSS